MNTLFACVVATFTLRFSVSLHISAILQRHTYVIITFIKVMHVEAFCLPFAVPRFRHFMILKKTLGSLERNLWVKYMDNTESPDIM